MTPFLAYLLSITTLIVSVGRLGDLTGHRRLLLAGLLLFTVASVLCGVAVAAVLIVVALAIALGNRALAARSSLPADLP